MQAAPNYRLQLKIGSGNYNTILPKPGGIPELKMETKTESGFQFLRDKLSGNLEFYGADFEALQNADIETEFWLRLQKQVGTTFVTVPPIVKFYKHDLKFLPNEEKAILKNFEGFDLYDSLLAAQNKELNLYDSAPEKSTVRFLRQGILQIAFPGANLVSNFLDGYFYELPCTPITSAPDDHNKMLNDYGFGIYENPGGGFNWIYGYIQGVGSGLDPDISGLYFCEDYTPNGNWLAGQGVGFKHVSENYWIEYGIGSPAPVVVRDAPLGTPGNILYRGTPGEQSVESPYHQGNGTTLVSQTDPASTCKFYTFKPYVRLLTNKPTVGGIATVELPDDDPFPRGTYTRALPIKTANFLYSDTATVAPTPYPKVYEFALHYAGRYFTKPAQPAATALLPVAPNTWTGVSAWFWLDDQLKDKLSEASETVTVKDAYKLADVLKVVLRDTGAGVTYAENTSHSHFFHANGTNTIRGAKKIPILIPITNATIGTYDQPAKKTPIRLSEIFNLLDYFYNVHPYINEAGLGLEHWQFFDNGRSYAGEQVGANVKGLINAQAHMPWVNNWDGYEYEKLNLPERIEYGWAAACSRPFEGNPIDVLSQFVSKGNIKSAKTTRFVSDLDFVLGNPDGQPKDVFLIVECEQGETGFDVLFNTFEMQGETYRLQNGFMAFAYAQNQYLRYGMPAPNIKINGEATTALSVERSKVESVFVPPIENLDKNKLIGTKQGNGRIVEMTQDLPSGFMTITLKHKI